MAIIPPIIYDPAANFSVFRAERFTFTILEGKDRYKIFQILFSKKDGSVFIDFPYFKSCKGLVSLAVMLGGTKFPADIDLVETGKVTSKRVKFSHHPDGRVHFSKTGQVRTAIRKSSRPLPCYSGHFFTLTVHGQRDFDRVSDRIDGIDYQKNRGYLNIQVPERYTGTLKFVGFYYDIMEMQKRRCGNISGPVIRTRNTNGEDNFAFSISFPIQYPLDQKILCIYCREVPADNPSRDSYIQFIGGFDDKSIINDNSVDTTFLAIGYPVENGEELAKRIGDIDLIRDENRTSKGDITFHSASTSQQATIPTLSLLPSPAPDE